MPQVRQRDALGVLTKPRLFEIAAALGLGLPRRLSSLRRNGALSAIPQILQAALDVRRVFGCS